MKTVIVDAVGEPCPIPVVKATKALRELGEPGTLEVRVDTEIAVQNLKKMAAILMLRLRHRWIPTRWICLVI